MYRVIRKNWEKVKYPLISGIFVILILLASVVYKSNDQIIKNTKNVNIQYQSPDIETFKKFIMKQIRSPFTNINYEIKKGDSIQKILKKLKVSDSEINKVIVEYKKYANPNQLLTNDKIDITIKENLSDNKKSIIKFSVPITKSTTISITKNEEGEILAKKIITKLYKKKTLAENVITKNLYSAAMEAKINPETIIEFARIFGFEIDFQRDIRKKDYFKILYEKYFDENGEFIKSGSILYAHMSVNGREISLYKFGNDKEYGYFDVNGKSVEKALMKTPINGARLSSPFGLSSPFSFSSFGDPLSGHFVQGHVDTTSSIKKIHFVNNIYL